MKFQKLTIKNFLTIGEAAPIDLQDKGLVLIQGVNEDDSSATSNGVGKSSIPDALCWAIYGVTARGETGDAVVNNVAKKNTNVLVEIEDGSTIYRIDRYRKHKDYKNQTFIHASTKANPTTWVDMTKGTEKETQEVINQVMGCSVEVFMAAIYAGQEEMPDLPKMTDKNLKLLIEEAAGVERLEEAYAIARKNRDEAVQSLALLSSNRERSRASLVTLMARIATARAEIVNFDITRNERAEEHKKLAAVVRAEMAMLAGNLKLVDEVALTAESEAIEEAIRSQDAMRVELRNRERAAESARSARDRIQIDLERVIREVNHLKSAFDNAEEEQKKPCPTCGHVAEDGHGVEEYRAHIKEKIATKVIEATSLKAARAEAQTALDAREQAVRDYEATMPSVSNLGDRRNTVSQKLRWVSDTKNSLRLKKKDYDAHMANALSAMTEACPHQALMDVLLEDEKSAKDIIAKLDESIAAVEEDVAVAESVVKVFGPAGVRAHILDTVTPFLNERTSDYLSVLSDGNISAVWSTLAENAKGELREKFNIEVENSKGGKSFGLLSGGEKRKVRLATMLALQDLVASRATKPIDLWIGDEIDDALDAAGLERLMGVLERKARERGTVLVVSHNELRDWVDNVTTVTKRGGVSVIEGALCE